MRTLGVCVLAAALFGCASAEVVRFQPKAQQEAIVRDGQAALISRQKNSIVMVRPAARQFRSGGRPVFAVGMYNLTPRPIEFRMADVEALQMADNGSAFTLKVYTYDELVTEERNRQTAAAVLTVLDAAANSYSASQAGYYNRTSTVSTPRGAYQVHTTGYSPTAAAIAQSNAAAQNEAAIAATIERGQVNLAALEQGVLKDNTLLVGPDRHEIAIVHDSVK
jgi:hypothetical protein